MIQNGLRRNSQPRYNGNGYLARKLTPVREDSFVNSGRKSPEAKALENNTQDPEWAKDDLALCFDMEPLVHVAKEKRAIVQGVLMFRRHCPIQWLSGSPDAGRTMLVSSTLSMFSPYREGAPGRQSTKTMNQLPSYEKDAWRDTENGIFVRDKELQTGMSVWDAARATCATPTYLMSASISAIVTTLWNKANNNANIETKIYEGVGHATIVR